MTRNRGYVYIMMNPSITGLVKIGKTTIDPDERAKQLSSSTGVATPFIVVYKREFHNCHAAEIAIHSILQEKGYRTNDAREFFSISCTEAINVLLSLSDPEDICNSDSEYSEETYSENETSMDFYNLAMNYRYGKNGYFQDYDKAIHYLELCGKLGVANAFQDLGYIYYYEKNDAVRAKLNYEEAVKRGLWLSYRYLALIFNDRRNSFYSPFNRDLAWNLFFTNLKEHESDIQDYDWTFGEYGMAVNSFIYLMCLDNIMIQGIAEEVIFNNRNKLKHSLEIELSRMERYGNQELSDSYRKQVEPFLLHIEENYLLSHSEGLELGKNYYLIAEKYLSGAPGYERSPVRAILLLKKSIELGYIKASALLGYCWILKCDQDKASRAWNQFNDKAKEVISGKSVSDDLRKIILEGYYLIYKYAIQNGITSIIDDTFVKLSIKYGINEYLMQLDLDIQKEKLAISQMPSYNFSDNLSTDELIASTDKHIRERDYQDNLKSFNLVSEFLKQFFVTHN